MPTECTLCGNDDSFLWPADRRSARVTAWMCDDCRTWTEADSVLI